MSRENDPFDGERLSDNLLDKNHHQDNENEIHQDL